MGSKQGVWKQVLLFAVSLPNGSPASDSYPDLLAVVCCLGVVWGLFCWGLVWGCWVGEAGRAGLPVC